MFLTQSLVDPFKSSSESGSLFSEFSLGKIGVLLRVKILEILIELLLEKIVDKIFIVVDILNLLSKFLHLRNRKFQVLIGRHSMLVLIRGSKLDDFLNDIYGFIP